MSKPKIIAFYLPQYHPTPDNDKWWGKGFTEWTNVGKAKPLFRGHNQPKVPADLGYYDLRLPEVREAQAELAREAGIYGFCYYHYWFGNGKEELELPFNEVLRLGKPDFPFMLCWANESWHKKFWDKDGNGSSKELLIEQTYPGAQDIIHHFYRLLPAFKDPRYIRINGKPAFMIYTPNELPNPSEFIGIWNELGEKEGIGQFHFIAQLREDTSYDNIERNIKEGFNAINTVRLTEAWRKSRTFLGRVWEKGLSLITGIPRIREYDKIFHRFIGKEDFLPKIYPTIIPNWDHTPRSGKNGAVLINSTPENFKSHVIEIIDCIKKKSPDDKICFLKSWNEWGEGNYVEPDLTYGDNYITTLKSILEFHN
ncbi:MAG: lipopolysaccharide biosynthesis protein [Bacteroides sp.]|nr:lipopolysaccharide biosynthesis protein [Bacteroides sp.]MBD5376032.1 lipopolysaccharide biosynthesis protein [Bacteroides sp.]